MNKRDRDAILQAAAKTVAWDLFAVAECGRSRTPVSVDRFDRQLRTVARQWNATYRNLNRNLTKRKEQ